MTKLLADVGRVRKGSPTRAVVHARTAALGALLAAGALACRKPRESDARATEPLRVAAAADLGTAFTEVGKAFEVSSGTKVSFTFGSTGQLSKQITEGAPYDVLAAANVSYVDDVVARGACLADTKTMYARGRIVLWASDRAALPATLEGLRDARFGRIALANPDHAPYGLAARQALQKAGLWTELQPRAVFGENIQQTFTFARSGNADVAFVALSLVIDGPGGYLSIDPALHAPLDQAMVVCKGGAGGGRPAEARAFVAYVGSDAGRAIMRRYGFLLPGEDLAPAR